MIGILNEQSFGFSKKGKCHGCGSKHTKEIMIREDRYIKLCDKCYEDLKEKIKVFD